MNVRSCGNDELEKAKIRGMVTGNVAKNVLPRLPLTKDRRRNVG